MTQKLFFSLLCVLLMSFSACKPNDSFDNYDLLLANDWQMVDRLEDNVSVLDSCDLDNVLSFSGTKDFVIDFGALICGSWEVSDREGKFNLNGSDGEEIVFTYSFRFENGRGSTKEYWTLAFSGDRLLLTEDVSDPNSTTPVRGEVYEAR
jgi:hypothetical protein